MGSGDNNFKSRKDGGHQVFQILGQGGMREENKKIFLSFSLLFNPARAPTSTDATPVKDFRAPHFFNEVYMLMGCREVKEECRVKI